MKPSLNEAKLINWSVLLLALVAVDDADVVDLLMTCFNTEDSKTQSSFCDVSATSVVPLMKR